MEKIPTKKKNDYVHDVTKAGLNAIPIVGGSIAVIFETVFSAPIDKRKEEWLVSLADTVEELCSKVDGLTPDKLSDNPEFISVYLQASNIAIRTHNEEKLNALRAAVKNSVLFENLDESKKMMFLRVVDQMTPLHFKVFHFLSVPEQYIRELDSRQPVNQQTHWGDLQNVWDETFKDIRSSNPLINLAISDLHSWGLIRIGAFHDASMVSVGTEFGKEFVEFISDET